MMVLLEGFLVLSALIVLILVFRVINIIYNINCKRRGEISVGGRRKEMVKTMIIAGSGKLSNIHNFLHGGLGHSLGYGTPNAK
jgi:hypothetical protein